MGTVPSGYLHEWSLLSGQVIHPRKLAGTNDRKPGNGDRCCLWQSHSFFDDLSLHLLFQVNSLPLYLPS